MFYRAPGARQQSRQDHHQRLLCSSYTTANSPGYQYIGHIPGESMKQKLENDTGYLDYIEILKSMAR